MPRWAYVHALAHTPSAGKTLFRRVAEQVKQNPARIARAALIAQAGKGGALVTSQGVMLTTQPNAAVKDALALARAGGEASGEAGASGGAGAASGEAAAPSRKKTGKKGRK